MQELDRKPRRSDGKNNRSLFRRSIFLMVVLGVGVFLPLIAQLYKLQIVEHEDWEKRAANQQTKNVSVAANRGTIYDREGRAMAMSATVYKLILSPMGVLGSVNKDDFKTADGKEDTAAYEKELYDRRKIIVDGIVDLFGYDEERLWSRIERINSGYEVLYYELEEEDAEKARAFISENKLSAGLQLTPSSKRYYPYSSVGSHVLGFMSQNKTSGDNKVGAQGIEMLYEDVLSGELGRVVTSKNGWGMEMISGYEMYFDAQNGYDVTLTLDERIQAMLEQTLAEGIETYDVVNGPSAWRSTLRPERCWAWPALRISIRTAMERSSTKVCKRNWTRSRKGKGRTATSTSRRLATPSRNSGGIARCPIPMSRDRCSSLSPCLWGWRRDSSLWTTIISVAGPNGWVTATSVVISIPATGIRRSPRR